MPQQSTRINSAQRMTVRLAIASGATVAMLIGAQALASTGRVNAVAANNFSNSNQSGFFSNSDDSSNFYGQDDQSYSNSRGQDSIQAAANQPNPFSRSSR